MKKRILASALLFAFLGTSWADKIEIVESKSDSWYMFSETIKVHNDGFSAMIAKKSKTQEDSEERSFVAVEFDTCVQQFGTLYSKKNETDKWIKTASIVISSPSTVGDRIGTAVCVLGTAKLNEKTSDDPVKNKKNSPSV